MSVMGQGVAALLYKDAQDTLPWCSAFDTDHYSQLITS